MIQSTDEILAAALALPAEARIMVAEQLLDSVGPVNQTDVDAEWVTEAQRRLRELNEGKAQTVSAEEVFRSLDVRLGREG